MHVPRFLRRAPTTVASAVLVTLLLGATATSAATRQATTARSGSSTTPAACGTGSAKLDGTFLDPSLFQGWTGGHWQTEYADMQAVCMHQVIVQYSADTGSGQTWYPSALGGYRMAYDLLTPVFHDAPAGMAIYIGLQVNNGAWYTDHANDPAFLAAEATKAEALAADITAHYRGDPTFKAHFAGWYLPFELDSYYFQEAAPPASPPPGCPVAATSAPATPWENMAACFFGPVSSALRAGMATGQRIITAPFFLQGPYAQTPNQWSQMWSYFLTHSAIDTIALQDGVGAEHATTSQLAPWYQATASAVAAANYSRRGAAIQLWDDPESYLMGVGNMPTGMLVADLHAVQPSLSKSTGGTCGTSPTGRCGDFVTFQFLHLSRLEAPLYYAAYSQYALTGQLPTSPPIAPSGLSSRALDAQTVRITWNVPTDPTVAGYFIYRWSGTGQSVAANRIGTILTPVPAADQCGTAVCLTDVQVAPGTTFTYAVGAFDATGLESTSTVTATTPGLLLGADLALGRPYSATAAADPSYPDPAGTKLTDGIFASPTDWTDPAWEGRLGSAAYSIVLDLGSIQSIAAVSSHWMQASQAGIEFPASVSYSLSGDGVSWTPAGTVIEPLIDQLAAPVLPYRELLPGAVGRFVKVDVQPSGSTWSFVDEVQVFAPAA